MLGDLYLYVLIPFCVSIVGAVFYTVFFHKYALILREYIQINFLHSAIKSIDKKISRLEKRIRKIEQLSGNQLEFMLWIQRKSVGLIYHGVTTILISIVMLFVVSTIVIKGYDLEKEQINVIGLSSASFFSFLLGFVFGSYFANVRQEYLGMRKMIDDVRNADEAIQDYRAKITQYLAKRVEKAASQQGNANAQMNG